MNSFILHFKPWGLALIVLGVIEGVYYFAAHPPRLTWNSFLQVNFAEYETFQRLVAHDKISALGDVQADIIQVGDSSGMHAVMPKVVMASMPGYTYLNLGVATNLGYSGYLNMARIGLRANPQAKCLVLYTCMIGAVPRQTLWHDTHALMSESIYDEFLRPARHFIQFPTLQTRPNVLGSTYYLNYFLRTREGLLTNNRGYFAFHSIAQGSLGWTRETDVEGDVPNNVFSYLRRDGSVPPDEPASLAGLRLAPRVTDDHFFDWWTLSNRSYFDVVYDAFADLAKEHKVKLVLVFNPMPEEIKYPIFDNLMDWAAIKNGLERVKARHPEVIVTSFDYWPSERFSVFSHVATPFAVHSSQRVADLLKEHLPPRSALEQNLNQLHKQSLTEFSVDFEKPYAGYGFVNQLKQTPEFPLWLMRGKESFVFGDILPTGRSLQMKVSFDQFSGSDTFTDLHAQCNGIELPVISMDVQSRTLTWALPTNAAEKYLGWLVLRFHRENDSKMIGFSKLKIAPTN
jgi:hypothetical protein